MRNNRFTIIKGGLDKGFDICAQDFVAGYISDTRLMGVLVIGLFFAKDQDPVKSIYNSKGYGIDPDKTFRMFFYVDIEEYGLETYRSVRGDNPEAIFVAENTMIGGLGAQKIPITLNEAKFVLQYYANYNKEHKLPLPEGIEEYGFLLEEKATLSEPDQYILMQKQCVRLINDYEVINYFLMRITGKDFVGAKYLTNGKVEMDLFPEYKSGTFCKNNVTPLDFDEGLYRSESLIEWGNDYYLLVTCITIQFNQVVKFERINSFKVSTSEAAMMLSQSEFINLYEFKGNYEEKAGIIEGILDHATVKRYESGSLFMLFHTDNRHVARADYRLSEDMIGNIFFSDGGHVVLAAYSDEDAKQTEDILKEADKGKNLVRISKMEFTEPVLYDYIQSGIHDFQKFLDIITHYE